MRALEDQTVMKTEMATYTPEMLGHGVANARGEYKKRRHAVLDKLSKLGQGISPSQQNDFAWFKHKWDETMLLEYGDQWGHVFATFVQHILNQINSGTTNAFSVMMHKETRRVIHGPALRL